MPAFPPKDVQRSPIPICTIMKNSREKSRVLPKAFDLFTGTGSVANRLRELGYHVTTLDIRPSCDPNICVDILTWRYWEVFSPGDFEVIGASVPCTEYSLAKQEAIQILGGLIVWLKKTFEIINYFQPSYWWVENPRSGYLKDREIVKNVPYLDLYYCLFSDWGYN